MNHVTTCCRSTVLWLLVLALVSFGQLPAQPISLHPENPHYFLWRGQPTVLIASGEHYGAVLNLDFDYRRYIDTLAAEGMMLTRTFSGVYVEPDGAFNIAQNSLAPLAGRYITPWARSDQPGYAKGGNKFDLGKWDSAYFERLKDFVQYAQQRGIVVEFTLFCPMYEEKQWALSPMNAANNVNGVGQIGREEVHSLDRNGRLLKVQEALTRKLVTELNEFDNVMFEICNEPYFGGVTMEWQHHIADIIVETERGLPKKHLITQNIANNQAQIVDPHPAVSVFNFHYATPPDTVAMNYQLQKVIGDNETGFRGIENLPYRTEGWDFILAGGGLYNNLDYSFVAGHEDGTFAYPATQPGGGNTQLRRELKVLREFIHGFNLVALRPDNSVIRGGVPAGGTARALVDPGRAIAVYVRSEGSTGPWSVRWTGSIVAPVDGEYAFHTVSNDGIRMWVDDQLLIDNWTDHSETEDTGRVKLKAGQQHPVRIEYFYNGGQGVTRLMWTPPGKKKELVPANAYRLPDKGWGLRGEYFHGNDLKQPWGTRDDGTVNFGWGAKPPLAGAAAEETAALQIELPAGTWQADWIDTKTGETAQSTVVEGGGVRSITAPRFQHDIALKLVNKKQ
ncbi:MAG: PA14 domain-containing protein [Pirellulales bacterium]